ncbi:MAG TPA: YdcF family protein [Terriglobales bacterium]|nr:YdcF family protein [Terriglobales bacterium]
MKRLRIVVLLALVLWLVAQSGNFLVVDRPQRADVILVLAGETDRRPTRALELLGQGYASRLVLDVPADGKVYGSTVVELARKWADSLPQASAIAVCPIHGLSTKAEALDASVCLRNVGGRSTLLVTSDFHTRRALSVFRRGIPARSFEVAAVYDSTQFGVQWWRHRQWAKTNLDEWLRLVWWQLLDRWF